jgi:hypothetical protein
MNILDIIHGVVVGFLFGQIQVKVQRAVIVAGQKDKPGRVAADLPDHIGQGDELTGPGRHGHGLAGPQQIDQLHQKHPELVALYPDASTAAFMRGM